jgi:nicotinamide-nucleotide amidase
MPIAEIIAIGTELLLGEIQDTNTRYLARTLRDAGIDLYRTMIVGDNAERISHVIRESASRSHIIITTGGLGPTVDDPTRQAVALAQGVEVEFRPELWQQIQNRFERFGRPATENNRRQAYIPAGAVPIENPVGTAPAFISEGETFVIISLPGVPREMEYLTENSVMPFLRNRYDLHGIIKACVIHAAGVGESQVDEWVGDLETFRNPTVGLLAHPGQIDVRVTAKAESVDEADKMIKDVVDLVLLRLGPAVYGYDQETLENIAVDRIKLRGFNTTILECGLGGELFLRLKKAGFPPDRVEVSSQSCDPDLFIKRLEKYRKNVNLDAVIGASYLPGSVQQILHLALVGPTLNLLETRSYGGPPGNGIFWGVNSTLDFIRRNL